MSRKMFMLLAVAAFIAGISGFSYAEMSCGDMDSGHNQNQQVAQSHPEHGQGSADAAEQAVSKEVINVGNKICPVSGEKVGEEGMKPATYEYKGKIYNFCCTDCVEKFKKDPEKYIKKIEEEKQKE